MLGKLFGSKPATLKPGPQLGMPAFATTACPSPEAIVRAWEDLFPDLPALQLERPPASKQDVGDVLSFAAGGRSVMLAHMPAPIPAGDIDDACKRSWMWSDAATEMKRQHSHAVVAAPPNGEPVNAAQTVSRLISAACKAGDAVGVYWGNGGQVHKPALFIDAVQTMSGPDSLPVMLWVGVMVSGASRDGPFTLSTCGMRPFGQREFEVIDAHGRPGDLQMQVYELVNYALTSGPVLKDGDTFGGESADDRVKIEHTTSRFRKGEPVIRLHLP